MQFWWMSNLFRPREGKSNKLRILFFLKFGVGISQISAYYSVPNGEVKAIIKFSTYLMMQIMIGCCVLPFSYSMILREIQEINSHLVF